MVRRAWLLNLDADRELAHPIGYAPPQRVLARLANHVGQPEGLVPDGDMVLPLETTAPRVAKGLVGIAWCPTPRALSLLEVAGAALPQAPALDIVQRVNHRYFCADLGQTLPLARYVRSRAEVDDTLAVPTPNGWLIKRPFSTSGSGRRHVVGELKPYEHDWLIASLANDGLQMEPMVERLLDVVIHGYVSAAGQYWLGEPLEQQCDHRGRWKASLALEAGTLSGVEGAALQQEAARVALALADSGYFGPFGIDAFRYRFDGEVRFNARCEINARYTMGWACGMGNLRPDLEAGAQPA